MNIDKVSYKLAKVAYWLNNQQEGILPEVWYSEQLKGKLENDFNSVKDIDQELVYLSELIEQIEEPRRLEYMNSMLKSLQYQIRNLHKPVILEEKFYECYRLKISKSSKSKLKKYADYVESLLEKLGHSDIEAFFKDGEIESSKLKKNFNKYFYKNRHKLPEWLTDFENSEFEIELVSDKPWAAYNYHTAPFRSKIEVNTDVELSESELKRLTFHEGYGGHHSELSLKDRLLVDEGRGEHGFVLVYSPQVLVSEALAEYARDFFIGDRSDEDKLTWGYNRLFFAAMNLGAFMYWKEKLDRDEISDKLSNYPLTRKGIQNVLNFVTDKVFGVYAPVYDISYHWLKDLVEESSNPQKLLKDLYTSPSTPEMY